MRETFIVINTWNITTSSRTITISYCIFRCRSKATKTCINKGKKSSLYRSWEKSYQYLLFVEELGPWNLPCWWRDTGPFLQRRPRCSWLGYHQDQRSPHQNSLQKCRPVVKGKNIFWTCLIGKSVHLYFLNDQQRLPNIWSHLYGLYFIARYSLETSLILIRPPTQ